ncbi:MAG: shikimate kinase [Candidatus Makaraimicrobium thalassicum]|nr:MAG: shikimate kinase [Candidatus Omnitrophota bacterium]
MGIGAKNIVLVGFMGTGKTVVSRALAGDMGKAYVSIDELIEEREKKAINDIFRDEGEPYFRRVEKEVVKEVAEKLDQVIDTGGGIVLDSENMRNLRKNGVTICLWAGPRVIYERTKGHGHRPLLNTRDPEKSIKELLDHRRSFYEKADFRVDTTDFDIAAVVERIKGIIAELDETTA